MRPVDGNFTAEYLKFLLKYEPETGVFTWLVRRAVNTPAGKQAGSVHAHTGYLLLKINGRAYTAARLAWLYMTGSWPTDLVDHADTDKLNNRWVNLRAASQGQNIQNRDGTAASGLKGAYRRSDRYRNKPWTSAINLDGRLKFLGNFHTAEEANAAYETAAIAHFGEFARS